MLELVFIRLEINQKCFANGAALRSSKKRYGRWVVWGHPHCPLHVPSVGSCPMAPMGEGWAMGGFRLGAGWSHHIPPLLLQEHLRCPLSWGTTTLAALEMLLPNVPSCAWHSSQLLGLGAYILIVQFYMMGHVNNSKGAFHPIPAVMPSALGGHPGEVLLPR